MHEQGKDEGSTDENRKWKEEANMDKAGYGSVGTAYVKQSISICI